MDLGQLRAKAEQLKGQRSQLQKQLKEARHSYVSAFRSLKATEEARAFIQKVAAQTQEQIRFHITDLGSMALEAVFGPGIQLGLDFEEKRGKTEARLCFVRGEERTDPLEADSGGASDIAAFALRCSLLMIQRPVPRKLLVLDEPFKNINDPTREMHQRAAEMVKEISQRLGIQFIIVTMLPELAEVADKVFMIK